MNNFGERLKKLLKLRRLSQQDIADALDIPRNTVWRWCNGISTPESNNLNNLATLLQLSVDELFNGAMPERWELKIKISDDKERDFIDMTKTMPCVSNLTVRNCFHNRNNNVQI